MEMYQNHTMDQRNQVHEKRMDHQKNDDDRMDHRKNDDDRMEVMPLLY